MVEGPGATRNALKAKQLVGTSTTTQSGENVVLTRVISIGKQVFLLWDNEKATRLHFGMNGSLGLARRSGGYYSKELPTLEMSFSDENQAKKSLVCYSTTVSHDLKASQVLSSFDRLAALDVCAPDEVFIPALVLQAIQSAKSSACLMDVLLDQAIFPGVGNIIKIEGLHRSQLHPQRTVQQCTVAELQRLIQECRNYARDWFRHGYAPRKLVYNQTTCQTCNKMTIRMAKMGQNLPRTTFWCEICQPKHYSAVDLNGVGAHPKVNHCVGVIKEGNENDSSSSAPSVLSCPLHGKTTIRLRRVRKQSSNQGRLFVSCSKCPSYFAWADSHFSCPKNTCQRAIRRLRISKTEHSGGRWFLSCPTCKSFAWANPAVDLKPLQSKLTPLL